MSTVDLANEVIRETYRPDPFFGSVTRSADDIREAITSAKRFILDADMSEMMGHLSTYPYELKRKRAAETLTAQRRSARLPFDKIFVQYDGRAFRRGLLAATGDKKDLWGKELLGDTADIIPNISWLMERIKGEDNQTEVVMVTEYVMDGKRVITIPFAWIWSPDDVDLSKSRWHSTTGEAYNFDVPSAQLAHGVTGYDDNSMAIIYTNRGGKPNIPQNMLIDVTDASGKLVFQTHFMVAESGGSIRYMLAFLSMLNEVPVSYERPRRTQPFLANGKRRVAVETQVIRLILPNRIITYRDYARELSRGIVKRSAHPVRGHWRVYGPHHCGEYDSHNWGATDASGHADCTRCPTSRTWINDYRTGALERTEAVNKMYSVGTRHAPT